MDKKMEIFGAEDFSSVTAVFMTISIHNNKWGLQNMALRYC
jgi:hypothetical protein